MCKVHLKKYLQQIHDILHAHQSMEADWIQSLVELCNHDELLLYKELNSKHMWGGAGSVANEALADNPGIEEWQWNAEIQQFRELMIEIGQHLIDRGNAYPDISSWLLAYSNWNQSGY